MKKYGLQINKIEDDHYYLGGGFIGTKEINPSGQWDGFLPPEEIQNTNGVETMNCTAFGTINAIEVLLNFLFHEVRNFSERAIGIMANTGPSGNDPHKVAEVVRRSGLFDDEYLPFKDVSSMEEYFSPKPLPSKLVKLGKKFLDEYDFKHEWVFRGGTIEEKNRLLKEALKRGPVALSVCAWDTREDGISYQSGPDNHWTVCYGFRDDIHAWKIFDTYDNCRKLYSMDSNIQLAKIYWLKKKDEQKISWIWRFINLFI